jgi:GNAT superfamily N-acetyltransferase
MVKVVRTNSSNKDFIQLVKSLDKLLALINGREHDFYNRYNKIDKINFAVVVYWNNVPVACGAIKEFSPNAMEVKRMFTLKEFRGKGLASTVLAELENWTVEMGYAKCILETGMQLPNAVRLYEKKGYRKIPNYGQYHCMDKSICFEKILKD